MESDQKFPTYVGGGDLWEEPDPPEPRWWQYSETWGAISLAFVALTFVFVGLTFWLQP